MNIKKIIENDDTKSGKTFDLVIQFLIIVSLVSFSIETIPELPEHILKSIHITEIICVILFTIEYTLRIWVSESKIKFIFSFYGLIDLIAILPFYLTTGIDLRSIRIFRLFRLFRLFKFIRYSKAINRLQKAFVSVKEELILFGITTAILLYVSSVGIYYFENAAQPDNFKSVFHCLWWSIITLTTVGYGDVYPITTGGKIFTSIISLLGIGVVAVPTGLVASALTKTIEEEKENKKEE